eukprot:jgi/Tetstr1/431110/TSEL_020826.t1
METGGAGPLDEDSVEPQQGCVGDGVAAEGGAAAGPAPLLDLPSPAGALQLCAVQRTTLQRLADSADRLEAFNRASAERHQAVATEMGRNTALLRTLRGDVVGVLKRVAELKRKLRAKYPDQFEPPPA